MNEKPVQYLDEWSELWRAIDVAYTQLMKYYNLSANTYCVLTLLLSKPEGVEPAEIADIVIIKRQMVTLILNDLDNKGWITRQGLKTDLRRKKIFLTEAGRKFAEEVINTVEEVGLRGVKMMSEEEQKQFFSLGRHFCDFLQHEVNRVIGQGDAK